MKFNSKPLIGITRASFSGGVMHFFICLNVFLSGGRVKRLDPLNSKGFQSCNGFIISGGADVNPEMYNEKNRSSVGIDYPRDAMEKEIIQHALKFKKPLLGICRGAQIINVVKGGDMYQEVSEEYEGFLPTNSLFAKAFLRRVVYLYSKSKLSSIFNPQKKIAVNSIHHQSIASVAKGLNVTAEDSLGVVQAVESENMEKEFILAVQWHPELLMYNKKNRLIFKKFIRKSIKNQT